MSISLMLKALNTKVGNPLRKLVLLKLADNASDQGECWPSYQHIADQCEIDRSTVRKHIKQLEAQGLLRIENREGPKGNSTNLYFLTLFGVGPESTGVGPEPTPPVGPESTRTSHSFETVKEPKHVDQQADLSALDKVNDLYNKITSGTFVRSRGLNDAKIKNIKACFKLKVEGRLLFRSLEFWERYFTFCLKNAHWRGETGSFKARLEFLTRKDIVQRTVDDLLEEMGVDDAA